MSNYYDGVLCLAKTMRIYVAYMNCMTQLGQLYVYKTGDCMTQLGQLDVYKTGEVTIEYDIFYNIFPS